MTAIIHPGRIGGTLCVPPSKSMAHRALICAALAGGQSCIENLSDSEDIAATRGALAQLGAQITPDGRGGCLVQGVKGKPLSPSGPVDCGESGSTLRFLIPLFSLTGAPVRLVGRGRLLARPQEVYERLFAEKGLTFTRRDGGLLVHGALPAGEYTLSGAVSSQFISGLLFALPLLPQDSVLHITPPFESRSYVGLTLQALADFGVEAAFLDEYTIRIKGGQEYRACVYAVEGDDSQAAFPALIGAARGGVTVTGLRTDSAQGDRVIFDILARCGAHLTRAGGTVSLEKSALRAAQIDLADCPDLGPVLMALGALCSGETVIRNAGRLRMKESDRIDAMETELRKMGADIASTHDTVTVRGGALHGADDLDGHNDHRVVMALAAAALAAGVPVRIAGAEAVRKSWPEFFSALGALGAEVEYHEDPA